MLLVAQICAILVLGYELLLLVAPMSWLNVGNQLGPAILFMTCLWSVYQYMKRSPLALWTPMPWFLVACAAYFGFGPLIYHYGSEASLRYIDTFFLVDEFSLLRTNFLNAVGIGVVAIGVIVGRTCFTSERPLRITPFNYVETRILMFTILVIGILVKYLLALPYYLGLVSWTLPGSVQYLSSFPKIAIILLFVLIQRGYSRYKWLLIILIGAELVTALMTLSKQPVIEVIIAIGLGWDLGRPNLRSLIFSGVVLVLLYVFVLSPFVLYSRLAAGTVGVGTVTEVNELVLDYAGMQNEDLMDIMSGVQGWWTRLSYLNEQSFAMEDYDKGAGGETIGLIRYVFLPRLFFPNKPIMTPGREFTEVITGEVTETATAAGIFAEAYWNGGGIMVAVVCLYVGVLFAGLTIFAERNIVMGKYEYLPIVMIGLSMGYSPNDWFVASYVGPLASVIVLYFVPHYLIMPLIRHRKNCTGNDNKGMENQLPKN